MIDALCKHEDFHLWLQATAAKRMRTALFWVITQRVVVVYYRRFGTTYRPIFKGQESGSWPLTVGPDNWILDFLRKYWMISSLHKFPFFSGLQFIFTKITIVDVTIKSSVLCCTYIHGQQTTYVFFFTYILCILILSKFFFPSPTDEQVNCLKNSFKHLH